MNNPRKFTVRQARNFAGMTQTELASRIGVSRISVSNWENNIKEMRKSHIIAFCSVTGFNEEELFLPKRFA